jgi:carbon monoxide dehydrogenase subunit G
MKLHNECVIAAPLSTTWPAVVDLARIAAALPGAVLERTETSGTFRGTMKIKFGPIVSEYAGTATLEEIDEDQHVAVVRIQGREVRGQGGAAATIRNALASVAGGTRLRIDTDLSVSGIAAQLGSGMIEEVSSTLLNDFAKRLERELSGAPNAPAETAFALDAGAAAASSLRRRIVPFAAYAAGLVAAAAWAYQLGRRSR